MVEGPHVLITGGAGYIGSKLTGVLLRHGYRVTVLDDLLFGGESLLGFMDYPGFRFAKVNVATADIDGYFDGVDHVVHLAAIVGFPACQAVGPEVARKYNVEAVQRVFDLAEGAGAQRFVFASTYSNYGLAEDDAPVTEESSLNPQSLYAETKIEAEQFLLEQAADAGCAPLIYRFATLFGISPRTRFDLIVNQFVLEALFNRELIIYQRGYARSFVHVGDIVQALRLGLEAPEADIRGEIYNVGHEDGNYTKDQIVALVQKHVPGTEVRYKDLSFGGDMRDIRVAFGKIQRRLGFDPQITVEQGVLEVRDAIQDGLIADPQDAKYRNAQFIVQ
ncbi:MAG: NAD(P)-dependent oxidoreductase [Candidatus Promineifilaceae bacterium]|nr:NAD(P)-dependent oxidoreductase [Candidatus Promineifilaceae bacterium]